MSNVMQLASPLVGNRLWSSPAQQKGRTSSGASFSLRPHALTVCQIDSDKSSAASAESSRRDFLIVATAASAGLVIQPDSAHAAKRKAPPAAVEKPPDEEKNLSNLDAKVLANIRRKEALQKLVENQKAKAKTARAPDVPPRDMFGGLPGLESESSSSSSGSESE